MRDRPSGASLLDAARRTVLNVLLPLLPSGSAYDARLVAAAMDIAAREIEQGDAPLRAELVQLATLYDEPVPSADSAASLEKALIGLNGRLAADIRAGKFDNEPAAVRAHLLETARAKLRENRPESLAALSSE